MHFNKSIKIHFSTFLFFCLNNDKCKQCQNSLFCKISLSVRLEGNGKKRQQTNKQKGGGGILDFS